MLNPHEALKGKALRRHIEMFQILVKDFQGTTFVIFKNSFVFK